MRYDVFLDRICRMVSDRLGEDAEVSLHKVLKNNGTVLDGLVIRDPSSAVAPTIYLNPYYQEAERGLPLSRITDHILMVREQNPGIPEEVIDSSEQFDVVTDKISYRLISREQNSRLLEEVPYYPYLDLAVVFSLVFETSIGTRVSTLVRNEHLEAWKVGKEALIPLAETASPILMPPSLVNLEEMLADRNSLPASATGAALELPVEEEIKRARESLYVLSNKLGAYGATSILFPGLLEDLADRLQDDLVLIPSSVHEFLISPKSMACPDETLNEMIRQVNQSEVLPEERLSDHAYYYSRELGTVWYPGMKTNCEIIPLFPESFS